MSFGWYVVYTHAQKEMLALQNLERQGFRTYLPRYEKTRRHARRVETILVPLFPRYVFVGIDMEVQSWSCIRSTRGVSYLLCGEDHRPTQVPLELIEAVRAQESPEGLVTSEVLALFHKGDEVRIREGAFADQVAICESMSDRDRVHLLLNFMQREVRVCLPTHLLEAA